MKALELDPKMQVAQRNLEIAYFNTGYYDTRVAELRERLRVRPDDRDARWELGRTYALLGQQDEAVAEFRALLQHIRATSARWCSSGWPRSSRATSSAAQQYLERALTLDPGELGRALHLGEVLYNRGLNDEALARARARGRSSIPTTPTRST